MTRLQGLVAIAAIAVLAWTLLAPSAGTGIDGRHVAAFLLIIIYIASERRQHD